MLPAKNLKIKSHHHRNYRPGLSTELREAMQFLLDNPEVAATMGKNAKKRALKLFAADLHRSQGTQPWHAKSLYFRCECEGSCEHT